MMKKCPGCYAIMKEMPSTAQVPKLQQSTDESLSGVSETRVRYECSQCGHTEESISKPAPAMRA